MSENYRSEGRIVTLENATAASNIAAGTPVAIATAANSVYTLGRTVTGFSGTGQSMGSRFIGVLDEAVSAGQSPINVIAQGVFQFTMSSAITTAYIGIPVFGDSGQVVEVVGSLTGTLSIGTIVGVPTGELSGQVVQVRIHPGALDNFEYLLDTGTEMGNVIPRIT